jgi:hypothetical protein
MIGDSYELFGTDTLFEITGEGKTYWVVAVRSPQGQKLGIRIEKRELAEAVTGKSLKKLVEMDAPAGR